jgi:PPP family 3-phenylpropionic acid transporter
LVLGFLSSSEPFIRSIELAMRGFAPFPKFVVLYTALYAAFGVISPFLPAFLQSHDLATEEIAAVMAMGTGIRLLSGPLAGRFSDHHRAWRSLFAGCAAAAAIAALLYLPAHGFWVLLLVTVAQASALAPLAPVADALALSASAGAAGKAFEYGWVRGTGSAAFIAGSIAAGHAAGLYDLEVVVWLNAILLSAAAFAVLPVPNIAVPCLDASTKRQAGDTTFLVRIAAFRRVLLIAALVLGSHALHDTYAVIRWNAAGIGTGTASLLWSESVGAEVIVFFLAGPALLRWLGPSRAIALVAAAAVLRWTVMGMSTHVVALALVEPLHGLTFALLHLACMAVIARTVPSRFAATAQAIYGTLAVGASTMLLTLGSGWLYAGMGGQAFWVMAVLCAAALPLAWGLPQRLVGETSAVPK